MQGNQKHQQQNNWAITMKEELFLLKHQLNGSINIQRKMAYFLAPAISTNHTVQFARIHIIFFFEIKDLLAKKGYCFSFSSVGTAKDTAWTVGTVKDTDWPVWPNR